MWRSWIVRAAGIGSAARACSIGLSSHHHGVKCPPVDMLGLVNSEAVVVYAQQMGDFDRDS